MSNVGIPIMKWNNRVVITKRLRDLLLEKIHDDVLTKDETIEIISKWSRELEETPYYIPLILPLLGYLLDTVGIDWNAHMDDKRVEAIANVIIALIVSFGR